MAFLFLLGEVLNDGFPGASVFFLKKFFKIVSISSRSEISACYSYARRIENWYPEAFVSLCGIVINQCMFLDLIQNTAPRKDYFPHEKHQTCQLTIKRLKKCNVESLVQYHIQKSIYTKIKQQRCLSNT